MAIRSTIWLEEIEDKVIRKHRVWPKEVEQLLANSPHVRFMERGHVPGEDLYAAFGQTDAGRYLAVFFIRKPREQALIISARDMTDNERKSYGKR
jgi:hypothetical protein